MTAEEPHSTDDGSTDNKDLTTPLEKARSLATISGCVITTSLVAAAALFTAPPLVLAGAIAIMALFVSLLSYCWLK